MAQSQINQQVSVLLEKIDQGNMTVQQLQNAYANTEKHQDITDQQREDIVEAITTQMRKSYPKIANKKFGPINRDSRHRLEIYLTKIKQEFDFSQNAHKTKVKVGGDVITGDTLANDYISYRNPKTKVMCHLFYIQQDHDSPRELHVEMNELKAWGKNNSKRVFPEADFGAACLLFENYLKRVIDGEYPN